MNLEDIMKKQIIKVKNDEELEIIKGRDRIYVSNIDDKFFDKLKFMYFISIQKIESRDENRFGKYIKLLGIVFL